MTLHPGQVISHYRLVEKIGEGGMGLVWKAVDALLEREVALKFLSDRLAADPARLARFEMEAKAVAALNHPNIVTIHSVENLEGSRFMTMEMVQGETLSRILSDRPLAARRIVELAIPIADAIGAAHSSGVNHRDLKPANIMVSPSGHVKILDFGLAGPMKPPQASTDSSVSTRSDDGQGRVVGTLPYMSPEQVRGKTLDHRTDIFSLGVILYRMATGRRPFEGETPADLIASLLKDNPPPVSNLNGAIPPELEALILGCLAKDPERRPGSAFQIRDRLEEIRKSLSGTERPDPSVAVLPFADLSPEGDQDYFCEGIAEEILNSLSRIRHLRVASRTSSFSFKGSGMKPRDIGRRLRVSTLLEGSLRKDGQRIRISVGLTDVRRGFLLWSQQYEREIRDIFAIQDEISCSVAASLRLTLTEGERTSLGKSPTENLAAYECYLRGRKFYYQYRRKGIEYALQLFRKAIEIDPAYAPAHAGIADCSAFLFLYAGRNSRDRQCADAASLKALELAPEAAQVHASRGVVLSLSGRHEEAEEAFEQAVKLDPDLFEGWYFYARACFARGLLEKAARLFERASDVNPEDYQSPLLVAQIYESMKRPFAAEAAQRRGLAVALKRLDLNPDDSRGLYMAANALVSLGEREKGLEMCERALRMEPDEPMLLYNVGCIQALAGHKERAIESLERAAESGLTQKEWYQMDSNLDSLRDEPRFRELLRKLPSTGRS